MFVASVLESLCLLMPGNMVLTVCIDKTITYIDKCSTIKRFPNNAYRDKQKCVCILSPQIITLITKQIATLT